MLVNTMTETEGMFFLLILYFIELLRFFQCSPSGFKYTISLNYFITYYCSFDFSSTYASFEYAYTASHADTVE